MIVSHKKRKYHGLLAGAFAAVLALPSIGYCGTAGSFDDDDAVPAAPAPEAPTEGRLPCPDGNCKTGSHKNETLKPIDSRVYTPTQREACYRNHLLAIAKVKVAAWYGNRGYSAGFCAQGVRQIMTAAGMNPIGGLGDAYHWKRDGKLKQLGFKDIYYPGMRPDQAPPGAILIFRGPKTLETNGRLPPRRKRRGLGAGNWVGHVTIAGGNGYYYTDGRTIDPAVRNRFLAGVFVPESCAMCGESVKRKCGG